VFVGVDVLVGVGSIPGIPPEHPVQRINNPKRKRKPDNRVCLFKIVLQEKDKYAVFYFNTFAKK
jgi:hypothetical protein